MTLPASEPLAKAPAEVIAAYQRLTPKQAAFALALPTATSATQAGIAAGYTAKYSDSKAAALARHPDVVAVVDWLVSSSLTAVQLTIENVMGILRDVVFSDPRQLFDPSTGALLPPDQWPAGASSSIAAVDVADIFEGVGPAREKVGEVHKLKFVDKMAAINTALKLLDAFPEKKKKVEHTHRIGVVVVPAKHGQRVPIEASAIAVPMDQPAKPSAPLKLTKASAPPA